MKQSILLFCLTPLLQAAIREGRWKYLSAGKCGEFLFDLESDTNEKRNLIAEHPERAAALKKELQTWANRFSPPGIPTGPNDPQEGPWCQFYFATPRNP